VSHPRIVEGILVVLLATLGVMSVELAQANTEVTGGFTRQTDPLLPKQCSVSGFGDAPGEASSYCLSGLGAHQVHGWCRAHHTTRRVGQWVPTGGHLGVSSVAICRPGERLTAWRMLTRTRIVPVSQLNGVHGLMAPRAATRGGLHEFNCTYAATSTAGSVNCFNGNGIYAVRLHCGNAFVRRVVRVDRTPASVGQWSQAFSGRDRAGRQLFVRDLFNKHF